MKENQNQELLSIKKLLKESEYHWLSERVVLLGVTGSHAYGTNQEGSDKDYLGVCIPPVEYFLGLQSFNGFRKSGEKGPSEADLKITTLNKFVKGAMQGVPNYLDILFLRNKDYLVVSNVGKKLIENRHLFISKNIVNKFGGYAHSVYRRLKTKRKEMDKKGESSDSLESVGQYDYDTKSFGHAIRMLTSAIEILETGDFNTYRENRNLLIDCRNGKYSYVEALEMIAYYDRELREALSRSEVKEKPDYQQINNFLVSLNQEFLKIG